MDRPQPQEEDRASPAPPRPEDGEQGALLAPPAGREENAPGGGRSPRARSRTPRVNDMALESPELRAKILELIDPQLCARVCNAPGAPPPIEAYLGLAGAPSASHRAGTPVFTFRFPLFHKRLFAVPDEIFAAFVIDLAEATAQPLESVTPLCIGVNVSHGAAFADIDGNFAKLNGYFSRLPNTAFARVLALVGPPGAAAWPAETQLEARAPASPTSPTQKRREQSAVFTNYSAPKAGVLPLAVTPEGRVFMLLQRPASSSNRSAFRMCKGGIDLAETPLQAAARELWEESGGLLCVPPEELAGCRQVTICRQHGGVWAAGCQLYLFPVSVPSEEWLRATTLSHAVCNGVDSAEVHWFALERPPGVAPPAPAPPAGYACVVPGYPPVFAPLQFVAAAPWFAVDHRAPPEGQHA